LILKDFDFMCLTHYKIKAVGTGKEVVGPGADLATDTLGHGIAA